MVSAVERSGAPRAHGPSAYGRAAGVTLNLFITNGLARSPKRTTRPNPFIWLDSIQKRERSKKNRSARAHAEGTGYAVWMTFRTRAFCLEISAATRPAMSRKAL